MKVRVSDILFSLMCLCSCTGNRENAIITYNLNKSDYFEKINIPGQVQAASNMPVAAPRNSSGGQMTVEKIASDGSFVMPGDTICTLSNLQLESSYRDLLNSIKILEAELQKAEADNNLNIAVLKADLESGETRLRIASLDTLKMKYAPQFQRDLLRLEIKKAQIEKEKAEKKLASAKKIAESDIRQKKARIIQEQMRAKTMEDQVRSMTIIASREGILMRAEMPRIMIGSSQGTGMLGGPVREGTLLVAGLPVLQFPDLSKMQISADAAESDFKRIEKGQKVIITVNTAEKLVTTGKVIRKSLAASAAQRYSASKVRTYEIVIDVDSCHSKMKPGLSSNCEIIIREVKDTVFVPTLAIFSKDSSNVVYVKKDNEFLPVKVETGISGDSYTIITSGLKGDEIIALAEPPESLVIKKEIKTDDSKNQSSR